jgi:hypothetical protein
MRGSAMSQRVDAKKREVAWKLEAVKKAFDSLVVACLADARASLGNLFSITE